MWSRVRIKKVIKPQKIFIYWPANISKNISLRAVMHVNIFFLFLLRTIIVLTEIIAGFQSNVEIKGGGLYIKDAKGQSSDWSYYWILLKTVSFLMWTCARVLYYTLLPSVLKSQIDIGCDIKLTMFNFLLMA